MEATPKTAMDLLAPPSPAANLDGIDLELLRLLSTDAARSKRRLAQALGMSAPAVAERVARLERLSVIRGYTIVIDWAALGYPMIVYMAITSVQGSAQNSVINALLQLPEVQDVSVVTGSIDLLARMIVRDHDHLRSLLQDDIWSIEGVQRTDTMIAIGDTSPIDFAQRLIESRLALEHSRVAKKDAE